MKRIFLLSLVCLYLLGNLTYAMDCLPFVSNNQPENLPAALVGSAHDLVFWYKKTDEREKQALREKVKSDHMVRRHALYACQGKQFLNMPIVMDFVNELSRLYPNDRLVGLGQSPAYFIEAAKIVRELQGASSDFDSIAFSGSFFPGYHNFITCRFRDLVLAPQSIDSDSYKTYLSKKNLSPQAIVDRAASGSKVIIVEYVLYGNGLASFLSFLLRWAQEDGLEQKLKVSLGLHLIGDNVEGCKFTFYDFDQRCTLFDPCLIAGLVNNDSSGDRLVLKYSPAWWGKMDPEKFVPERTAQLMRFWLVDYLNTKIRAQA